MYIIILTFFATNLKRKKYILPKYLFSKIVKDSKKKLKNNNNRLKKEKLGSTYYGGANRESEQNLLENELKNLLTNGWLSNVEIDAYLASIQDNSEVTIHHSDVALLLQGGAGEFADTNHTHPSQWENVNIIPTIIRSSEYVGVHWVLLEIIMSSRKIKLYDPLGIGQEYQQALLDVISQTLCEEVAPRGKWSTEIVEGMERQKDSFNCGVFVTAWTESAKRGGKIENCLRKGKEKHFRLKMYKALTEIRGGEICGGISVKKEDGNNESSVKENSMKVENDKFLDKYLKQKTINHMREMIGLCTTIHKEHRKMLIDLIN